MRVTTDTITDADILKLEDDGRMTRTMIKIALDPTAHRLKRMTARAYCAERHNARLVKP